MSSVFKSFAKYSDTALTSMKNSIKRLKGSVKSFNTVKRLGPQVSQINNALDAAASAQRGVDDVEQTAAKASQLEAENLAKSSDQVKQSAGEIKGLSSAAKRSRAEAEAASKGISTTTKVLGVSGAVLVSLGLAAFLETDDTLIDITNIQYYNSRSVKVTFNVAVGSGGPNFALRPGNTITFDSTRMAVLTNPSLGAEDKQVTEILDDHNFLIGVSSLPIFIGTVRGVSGSSPSGLTLSGSPSPSGSSYWGQARVHSDFLSQFTGAIGDTAALVGGAASEVVDATATALTPGLVSATGTAATTLASMLAAAAPGVVSITSTATGAAKNIFCNTLPLACNPMLWAGVAGLCVFIICIFIITKLKR